MSFLGKLLNLGTLGITGTLGIGMKDKPKGPFSDVNQDLVNYLAPIYKTQANTMSTSAAAGAKDIATGRNDLEYVTNWLKTLHTGSDDELLKMLDASEVTRNADDQEQQLSEFGVRGGARAAGLAQAGFNKDAALNRVLQGLRFAAPDKIANIATMIANIGVNETNASLNAGGQAANILFGVEGIAQQAKDRKNALIGQILGTAGTALGAWLGNR